MIEKLLEFARKRRTKDEELNKKLREGDEEAINKSSQLTY